MPAGVQPLDDPLGGLVGVHLVADEQQRVRPRVVRRARHPLGERDEGVGPEGRDVLLVERVGPPAAPEGESEGRIGSIARMTLGGNDVVGGWPGSPFVELDGVLAGGRGRQVLDEHECIMVTVDGPRVGGESLVADDDRHCAGSVGLDPDRGALLVGVAQQRTDEQGRVATRSRVRPCRHGGEAYSAAGVALQVAGCARGSSPEPGCLAGVGACSAAASAVSTVHRSAAHGRRAHRGSWLWLCRRATQAGEDRKPAQRAAQGASAGARSELPVRYHPGHPPSKASSK